MTETTMEKLVSLAKRRGFIYQGSEIYGGLAGTWDFGPNGVSLKNNIKADWWRTFVDQRSDIYGLDAAILMNPQTWVASGHVDGFHDPLVEDTKTKKRYRADHLLEEQGIENADELSVSEMDTKIKELKLKSPDGNALGEVQQFNMMLATKFGASESTATDVYLRPETAQGIFTNYKNIVDTLHPALPFGIAQIGKAFRNEITPRDFLFRQREFEQMEIQYFIPEASQKEAYETWRKSAWNWLTSIGLDESHLKWHEHTENERAHYAAAAVDIQYAFPFGTKELHGIHNRTDFDLTAHMKESGVDLHYADPSTGKKTMPYVIESSVGLDRIILAVLNDAYTEEEVGEETRVVLKFEPRLAPVKAAILPLMRKPQLKEKAQALYDELKKEFVMQYDETGSIGKRYRRQDEIGTPFCITVDFDTLEDDAVTVRDRDTMKQDRVSVADLSEYVGQKLSQ